MAGNRFRSISNHSQRIVTFTLSALCFGLAIAYPDWLKVAASEGYSGLDARVQVQLSGICADSTDMDLTTISCDGAVNDDATRALVHDELGTMGTTATQTGFTTIHQVGRRIVALRNGASGIQIAGVRDSSGKAFSGKLELEDLLGEDSAAGDVFSESFGAFFNGFGEFGNRDSTDEEIGYKYYGGGVIAGMDYRFTDRFVAGGAFSWQRHEADFRSSAGNLQIDTYTGSLYGYYAAEDFYLDGILSYSYKDYDMTRRLRGLAGPRPNRNADSDAEGDEVSFSAGGGYTFTHGALSGGPTARINVIQLWVDDFSESGAAGANLRYDDFDVTSVTLDAGAEVSYDISTPFGIFTPQIRGEIVHEFADDGQTLSARFKADTSAGRITVITDNPDRNYGRFGASVSTQLEGGISLFVDYELLIGLDEVHSNLFTIGGRFEF